MAAASMGTNDGASLPNGLDGRARDRGHRSGGATGMAGNIVAILVNVVLLFVARNLLGWDVVPFLTDDFDRVLPAITVSLLATIALHGIRLVHDSRRFTIATDAVATGLSVYATVRLYQVFPFEFDATGFPWPVLVRALLIVVLVGSVISIVSAPFRLLLGADRASS